MPFIHSVYIILAKDNVLIFFGTVVHWYLIKIRVELILKNFYFGVVSHCHSCLIISENLIFFNFRKTGPWTNYTWSLIFTYLIIWNVVTGVEDDNTITIIVYVIMLYPTETTLYGENTFGSWLENPIIQNQSVCWVISTVCYIGLVISENFVFLDQGWCRINKKDSLSKITEYIVIYNFDLGRVTCLDTWFSIVANVMIFFDSCEIFFTFAVNSVFKIFFDIVVSYDSIRSQLILGQNMDSIALVFPDFVKHNQWIRTNSLDTILAFLNFTKLNLCSISSLNTNSWPFDLTNFASDNLWFSTYALQIDSNQLTIENIWVLNDNSVIPLADDMHSSLLEVGEFSVRTLEIWIDRNYTSCVICLISNKFTTYQIYGGGRKTYKTCEFLIQFVWDWLQTENTFSKDDTTRIDADNSVHTSRNVEFLKAFGTGFLSVFHVLLGFDEFLLQFQTWVSEDDSFEIDQSSFLKHDIDDSSLTSNNDNLGIFISLFNSQTSLANRFFTGINSLFKSDNGIFISEINGHF